MWVYRLQALTRNARPGCYFTHLVCKILRPAQEFPLVGLHGARCPPRAPPASLPPPTLASWRGKITQIIKLTINTFLKASGIVKSNSNLIAVHLWKCVTWVDGEEEYVKSEVVMSENLSPIISATSPKQHLHPWYLFPCNKPLYLISVFIKRNAYFFVHPESVMLKLEPRKHFTIGAEQCQSYPRHLGVAFKREAKSETRSGKLKQSRKVCRTYIYRRYLGYVAILEKKSNHKIPYVDHTIL